MNNSDTGILLDKKNITLNRIYFEELVRLLGIQTLYRAPLKNKHYNGYGELDSFFALPTKVGCIFEEHYDQKSMKKLGWNAELQESSSIIHVPYNMPGLESGGIFIIPSGLDNAEGRLFRVIQLSNIAIYPASIACEIAPLFQSDDEDSTTIDYAQNNFTLLTGDKDD